MASTYVRRFNLKESLSNQQVATFWTFLLGDFVPAIQKVQGVNACKVYSGAGALRADIRLVADMDHAGVYEGLLREPTITPVAGHILWGDGPNDINPDVHPGSDDRPAEGVEFVANRNPNALWPMGGPPSERVVQIGTRVMAWVATLGNRRAPALFSQDSLVD